MRQFLHENPTEEELSVSQLQNGGTPISVREGTVSLLVMAAGATLHPPLGELGRQVSHSGGMDMRAHYTMAIIVVLVIGVLTKWFFFSTAPAEAQMRSTLDVFQMTIDHPNIKTLPAQDVKEPF
jgi:hypothetical protein